MTYWLVMAVLIVMSMVFLMLTHQSDPGIIPPKVMKDPMIIALECGAMDPVEAGSSSGIWKGVDGQWNRLPPNGYLGMDPERYCVTCNIWRPPRASHCSICGFCFEVRRPHLSRLFAPPTPPTPPSPGVCRRARRPVWCWVCQDATRSDGCRERGGLESLVHVALRVRVALRGGGVVGSPAAGFHLVVWESGLVTMD